MITSRTTLKVAKPTHDNKITRGALAYLQTRNRFRLFNLLHEAFKRSGLTQATLARRLGLGTDRVCKILGSPANLTLDTISDLFFAIEGAELDYSLSPLDLALEKQPETHTTARVSPIVDWDMREAA
jgi:hypothetical protein